MTRQPKDEPRHTEPVIRKGSKWRHRVRALEVEVVWAGGKHVHWNLSSRSNRYPAIGSREQFLQNFELVEEVASEDNA